MFKGHVPSVFVVLNPQSGPLTHRQATSISAAVFQLGSGRTRQAWFCQAQPLSVTTVAQLAVVITVVIDKACDFAQKRRVKTGKGWKEL